MKFPISEQIRSVHFPPISEVREWAASYQPIAGRDLIDLCQAVPDYLRHRNWLCISRESSPTR